jgi:cell division protein ZapA
MDELTITVQIADRPYRLKIPKEEEEVVRKAVKLISEKINEYSSDYAFNDRQDLLAMVTVHFAVAAKKMDEEHNHEKEKLTNSLGDIESKLTEYLD